MTLALSMDRHTLALISIVGCSLDVLGALYLAYDLLGGEHGPLRTLTRGVTYGVLFGAGYGRRAARILSDPQQRRVRGHRMTLDKHILALISIIGSSLDVVGALYLAYDL